MKNRTVKCPHCGTELQGENIPEGAKILCPECNNKFRAEFPSKELKAPPAASSFKDWTKAHRYHIGISLAIVILLTVGVFVRASYYSAERERLRQLEKRERLIEQIQRNIQTQNADIRLKEVEKICTLLSDNITEEQREKLVGCIDSAINTPLPNRVRFLANLETTIQKSGIPGEDTKRIHDINQKKLQSLSQIFKEEIFYFHKVAQLESEMSVHKYCRSKYHQEFCDSQYEDAKIVFTAISMFFIDKTSGLLHLQNISEEQKKKILTNLTCKSCNGHGILRCSHCDHGRRLVYRGTVSAFNMKERVYDDPRHVYGSERCAFCKNSGQQACRKCQGVGFSANEHSRQQRIMAQNILVTQLKRTKSILDAQLDE